MSARIVLPRIVAFAAAVALVGGCAVTRIDVDVYKGPLANHEHVQTQQMAVMAVGAEQLLARLKEKLEEKLDDRGKPHPLAATVDATLRLFKDQGKLAEIREKGKEAFKEFEKAVIILDEIEPSPQLIRLRDALKNVGVDNSRLRELAKAFGAFLVPDRRKNRFRDWGSVFKQIKDLPESERKAILDGLELDMLPDKDHPGRDSSNGAYKQLQDDGFLRRMAERFFPNDGPMQDDFVREVKHIALSFTEARQALEKLLVWSLRGLSLSDEISGPMKKSLITDVSKVVARIIQTEHLRLAIDDPGTSLAIGELRTRLEAQMAPVAPETFRDFKMWDDEDEKGTSPEIEPVLQRVIQEKPVETSLALLEAHEKFVTSLRLARNSTLRAYGPVKDKCWQKQIQPDECVKAHYGAAARRQYGLVDGPILGEQQKKDLKEIYKRAEETLDRALPLGRGRLSDGLNTLIEDYLNAAKAEILKPCDSDQSCDRRGESTADRKRKILSDALVGFAEKILFIANHEGLLSKPGAQREAIDLETRTYVRVLQAVGNSILIQADELQHRAAHRRGLEDAKDREARALAANPHKVLENLVQELKARAVAVRERLADLNKQLAEAEKNVNSKQQNRNSAKKALDEARGHLKKEEDALRGLIVKVAPWDQAETILEEATLKDKRGGTRPFATILKEDVFAKLGETPKKATEIRDAVVSAIKGELSKETRAHKPNVTSRARALEKAHDKIADLSTTEVNKIPDGKAETVFPQLREIFDHEITKLRLEIDAQHQTIAGKKDQVREKNDALIAAEEALKIAEAKKREIAQVEKDSETRLANTVEMIEAHRQEALAGFNPAKDDVTPSAVLLLVRTVLHKAQALLAATDPKWQKYQDALDVLDKTAMSATATASLAGGSKTSKDALDQLIAALRHEHVQAVRLYGENSGTAKNAKDALAAAYEHRSGMVYIRPSGAYLRSSYPATALQGDPRLGWENMLSAHNLRSIPFFGAKLVNYGEKENLEIQSEIDKQFWQNINSVRVAGAGRTNYVMAKDDIGNWYVKKYSSNPEDIIQSTKNLALFGMGSKLNTNLIRRAREQEQQAAGQPVTPQRPPLGRVLDQEAENYDTRTKSHYDALRSTLAEVGIARTVRSAWESMAETSAFGTDKKSSLLGQIEPAHGETLKPVHDDLAANVDKKDGRANRILTGLDALLRFHKALKEKIAALDLTKTAADKLKSDEKAKSDAEFRLQEANKKLLQAQSDLLKAQKDLDALSAEADKNEATKKRDEAQGKVTAADQEVQKEKTAVEAAAKAVDAAKATLEKAKNAESFVLTEVTRIVRGEILKVAGQRVNAVEKLEAATMFIGNATKAQ